MEVIYMLKIIRVLLFMLNLYKYLIIYFLVGYTPLFIALLEGHGKLAVTLAELGSPLTCTGAAVTDFPSIQEVNSCTNIKGVPAEYLVKLGLEINSPNWPFSHVLDKANTIRKFLCFGISDGNKQQSPLFYLAGSADSVVVRNYLRLVAYLDFLGGAKRIEENFDMVSTQYIEFTLHCIYKTTWQHEMSPFFQATITGDVEKLFNLVENGEDVNKFSPIGWTALQLAVFVGQVDSFFSLIQLKASVNHVTHEGMFSYFVNFIIHYLHCFREFFTAPGGAERKLVNG